MRRLRLGPTSLALAPLLAWTAIATSEPKVIGRTEKDVRVVRGGKDAPAAAPATGAAPTSPAAPVSSPTAAPAPAGERALPALGARAREAFDLIDRMSQLPMPRPGANAEAKALARRLVAAYGGASALEAWLAGGVRKGTMTIFQPASVQGDFTTRQRGESMRLDLKTAAFGVTIVVRPEGGWQNMLGLVSDVADEQREEMAVARAHDESLILDAAAGRVPAARIATDGGEALVVWGPRGDPTGFIVSAGSDRVTATAFRDRSALRNVKVAHVFEYDDWRELAPGSADARGPAGAAVPFELHHAMDGLPVERMRLTSVDLLAAIDDSVFARPGETKLALGAAKRVTLPLERHGGHHYAWVRLNGGPPRRFLVDTGAGITAISRELADTLQLQLGGEAGVVALGGGVGAHSAMLESVGLGTIERRDVSCIVMDFGEIRSGLGASMEGILGFSALNRLAVTFDFEHDALVLAEGGEATSPGARGTRVRFQTLGGQISVPGRLDGGEEFPLILDTGAGITFVPEYAVHGMSAVARVPGIEYVGVDGRALEGEALRVRSLSIGALRIDRPIVVTASSAGVSDPTGLTLGSGSRGVLGANVLRRLKLTIDYPRGEIVLAPIANAPADDGGLVGPGVVVSDEGDALIVRAVVHGSPAARAGVVPGDFVLAIDGRNVDQMSAIPGGAQLFGASGSNVELTLRAKDGRRRTLRLERAPLL